jgi:hypothetical protein
MRVRNKQDFWVFWITMYHLSHRKKFRGPFFFDRSYLYSVCPGFPILQLNEYLGAQTLSPRTSTISLIYREQFSKNFNLCHANLHHAPCSFCSDVLFEFALASCEMHRNPALRCLNKERAYGHAHTCKMHRKHGHKHMQNTLTRTHACKPGRTIAHITIAVMPTAQTHVHSNV